MKATPLHIGFTGTREGMTRAQERAVALLVLDVCADVQEAIGEVWVHHGDCVGADEDFHRMVGCGLMGLIRTGDIKTHIHPPQHRAFRAFCSGDRVDKPAPYRVRNQAIVDACDVLIAAPLSVSGVNRGGTWMTICMALRAGKDVWLATRDGCGMQWVTREGER